MFLRVFERLCDSSLSRKGSTADNFLVFTFISLAQQMTKKTNVGLRRFSSLKNKSKDFLFFHCGSHWKQNNQLLFWVCFSLKSVVKSVRISLFNLTVVWHLVNCPNRWINNLRLRIFYRPTLCFFCFTLTNWCVGCLIWVLYLVLLLIL